MGWEVLVIELLPFSVIKSPKSHMNSAPVSTVVCATDLTLLCKSRMIKELRSCSSSSGSQPTAGEQPLRPGPASSACSFLPGLLYRSQDFPASWPASLRGDPKTRLLHTGFVTTVFQHNLLGRTTKAERTPPRLFSKERSLTQTPTQGQCTRGSTLPQQHPSLLSPAAVRDHTSILLSENSLLFLPDLFFPKNCHFEKKKSENKEN